jgi:hypothetical protein
MIYVAPSASFEAVVQGFATGLTGTIGVRLIDNTGATSIARTTVGITEFPASSGIYQVTLTAPSTAGQYTIVWDDGSVDPSSVATEELTVTTSTQVQVVSGSFSYDITTVLGKTRLEIGDTDSTAQLFTDEELNVYIDTRSDNVLLAAADACDALASRFARAYNISTDGQSFARGQMSKMWADRATSLRGRAGGITTVDVTVVDGYSDDVANQEVTGGGTANPRHYWYRVGVADLP